MARRVIALLGGPPVTVEERKAAEAITPGHLLNIDGNGKWIKNTANAANIARTFALERDELGNDIDHAYAIGDQVKAGTFHGGQRVYAFIPSGQNVTDGDYLTGDATGCLTKTGVTTSLRLGRAVESVDNSAGPGNVRIRVELV